MINILLTIALLLVWIGLAAFSVWVWYKLYTRLLTELKELK